MAYEYYSLCVPYKSLRCLSQSRATQRLSACKYSVSHHIVIKLFLLLGLAAEYSSVLLHKRVYY